MMYSHCFSQDVGLAGGCWHCGLGWVLFQDFGYYEEGKHSGRSVGLHWERFGRPQDDVLI